MMVVDSITFSLSNLEDPYLGCGVLFHSGTKIHGRESTLITVDSTIGKSR